MRRQVYIKKLYILPTFNLYVLFIFIFIAEKAVTSALYTIGWVAFVTEIKSDYCAVLIDSINISFRFAVKVDVESGNCRCSKLRHSNIHVFPLYTLTVWSKYKSRAWVKISCP
jgi:hypothetical protein